MVVNMTGETSKNASIREGSASSLPRVDIDSPRWDRSTFLGRFKYFAWITDPRTVVTSTQKLEDARTLLESYRQGQAPPGTTEKQLWYAKKLYLSAFHPDSGDMQNVIGRMSFQVPGGMLITGAMLQFYRTNTAVIFWQWLNQSFNALVNYTNRNAATDMSSTKMLVAYMSATSSAIITAIGLKKALAKSASSLMQRYVPYAAVAAANMVNIPLSRQNEITEGVVLCDENGNEVCKSKYAAMKGISQVVLSRIIMAGPGMLITPIIMERLEKIAWVRRMTPLHAPIQTALVGVVLVVMVPAACSLFPQQCSISVEKLKKMDAQQYQHVKDKYGENVPKILYFNKGL